MNMPFFLEITIICASVLGALPLLRKLGIATLTAYLIIGLGLSVCLSIIDFQLNSSAVIMEWLALALMFFLGLQLKPSQIKQLSRSFILTYGLATCCITAILTVLILSFTSLAFNIALLLALAFSISSLLWMSPEFSRTPTHSVVIPHVHTSFLLLHGAIFTVVLMSLPLFSGFVHPQQAFGYLSALVAICSGLVWLSQTWFLNFFEWLDRHQANELSILFILGFAFALFTLLYSMDISVLLGALLLGIVLADLPFQTHINSILAPWKVISIGLFFSCVALQLDFQILITHLSFIVMATTLLLISKWVVWSCAIYLQTKQFASSIRRSLAFAHTGEASLILVLLLLTHDVFDTLQAQILSWIIILILLLYPAIEQIPRLIQLKYRKTLTTATVTDPNQTTETQSSLKNPIHLNQT